MVVEAVTYPIWRTMQGGGEEEEKGKFPRKCNFLFWPDFFSSFSVWHSAAAVSSRGPPSEMISQRGKKEKREEINCVSLFQKAWGNGGRKFLAKNGIKLFSFSENASLPFFSRDLEIGQVREKHRMFLPFLLPPTRIRDEKSPTFIKRNSKYQIVT